MDYKPTFRTSRNRFFTKQVPKAQPQHNTSSTADAERIRLRGNELFKQRRYLDSIQCYNQCIKMDGPKTVYFLNKTRCLMELHSYDQALSTVQKVFDLQQNNIKACLMRGQILCQVAKADPSLERMNAGVESLKKALRQCHTQNRPEFDKDVSEHLFKGLKVRWYKEQQLQKSYRSEVIQRLKEIKQSPYIIKKIQYTSPCFRIPEYLICPITMELMEEPVITDAGVTYERHAISDHLLHNGLNDPTTRKPVSNRLTLNLAVKQMVQRFLEQNPWAYDYIESQNWRTITI